MAADGPSRSAASAPVPAHGAGAPQSPKALPRRQVVLIVVLLLLLACAPLLYRRTTQSAEASACLDRGVQLLAQGHPAEAEQAWQTAARLTPDNPNVYRALCALYRAQGRLAEAHAVSNRLADVAPGEPHVLCELAADELRLSRQQVSEDAAHDAVRAATLEPNCVRALTVAGDATILKGDYRQGLAYLRRAVRLKPEDVPLTLHLINKMLEGSDVAGVLQVTRDLIRRYPGYAQGYVLMATVCDLYPRHSPEARSTEGLLRTALRLDPTSALAHAKLGVLCINAGDGKRALPHLEAAQYLGYDQPSLIFNLSRAYTLTGQRAAARRALDDFLQISRLDNARGVLGKQRVLSPNDAGLQRRLAAVDDALARARRAYRARWSLAPTAPPPYADGREAQAAAPQKPGEARP